MSEGVNPIKIDGIKNLVKEQPKKTRIKKDKITNSEEKALLLQKKEELKRLKEINKNEILKARFLRYEEKVEKERVKNEKILLQNNKKLKLEVKQKAKKVTEEKAKNSFKSFFVKSDVIKSSTSEVHKEKLLQRRKTLDDNKERLDTEMSDQKATLEMCLKELKSKRKRLEKKSQTMQGCDIEVLRNTFCVKFFSFHDNFRPCYYGTWRKRSKTIKGRNPLKKDEAFLNYDWDSDEDWEEEVAGESIQSTDDEEETEKVSDYEEDEGFVVDHGHLSDDEISDTEFLDEKSRKVHEQLKLKEWKENINKKKKVYDVLKPFYFNTNNHDEACEEILNKIKALTIVTLVPLPILVYGVNSERTDLPKTPLNSRKKDFPEKVYYPNFLFGTSIMRCKIDDLFRCMRSTLPYLIYFTHQNPRSITFLMKEFQLFWQKKHFQCMPSSAIANEEKETPGIFVITKREIKTAIRKIGIYRRSGKINRFCWVVKDEVLEEYKENLEEIGKELGPHSLLASEEMIVESDNGCLENDESSVKNTTPLKSPQNRSILSYLKQQRNNPTCPTTQIIQL